MARVRTLTNGHRRDSIIPSVAIAEPFPAKVSNASTKFLASAAEVAIVINGHARIAEKLERGNVVSKISGKAVQPIAFPDAETIPLKPAILEETGPGTRHGTPIPGGVPFGVIPIDPGILRANGESATEQTEHK